MIEIYRLTYRSRFVMNYRSSRLFRNFMVNIGCDSGARGSASSNLHQYAVCACLMLQNDKSSRASSNAQTVVRARNSVKDIKHF